MKKMSTWTDSMPFVSMMARYADWLTIINFIVTLLECLCYQLLLRSINIMIKKEESITFKSRRCWRKKRGRRTHLHLLKNLQFHKLLKKNASSKIQMRIRKNIFNRLSWAREFFHLLMILKWSWNPFKVTPFKIWTLD